VKVFERLTGGPDPARVRDELIALKEPERRKRAKAAEREFRAVAWRGSRDRPSRRWRAAAIAWVGTATARKLVSEFWQVGFELDSHPDLADDVYAVLAARGRAFYETFARGLLRSEGAWGSWPLVRRAVREGLIEPPDGDEYVRRMVFGVSLSGSHEEIDSAYKGLLADPALLEREVWELFEIDAAGELANANTWEQKEPSKPAEGYARGDNRWLYALTRLAGEGRLDRERLLDASLDALMRDFRASTVGWYAKLHEELEPKRDERLARLDRYLALVTSPAPAVVKEGLAALRDVEDAVEPAAFARVAPTPFTQRQKNLSTETLSLLARLCKRHADDRPVLLEAAAHALGHERADVQERALKLLEQYPDDAPRGALLAYVEAVAPTLRPRIEALTGVVAPKEVAAVDIEIRAAVQPRPTLELVREARIELVPVESVDELIEVAAMLVEGQGDGDDCERFLDGVSRLCDQRPPGFDRRTAGLLKRVEALRMYGAEANGTELIAYVAEAWIRRRQPRATMTSAKTILGFLARRAEEVARRAARGSARPLLAFPTHTGGWIDPEALQERRRERRADPLDELQARVRAFPVVGSLGFELRVETRVQWGNTTRELRLVCADVPAELGELGPLAATAGAVEGSRWAWYGTGWAGFDALGVRWALTVLPSQPEVAFAGAARAAVDVREGPAYYHPDAVLEHALDPHIPLGREAWLAAAACLVAKPPELPRVAVDLLVQSIEDGRYDAVALGEATAWLLDEDFAKANRLEAPLRDIARVSPLHAAQVVRLVEGVLAHLETRPHGLHAVLEVAVESSTATGRRIDDEQARAALARIASDVSATSKVGKLAGSLLTPR
jgi:Family of unknown function (DUF6493)